MTDEPRPGDNIADAMHWAAQNGRGRLLATWQPTDPQSLDEITAAAQTIAMPMLEAEEHATLVLIGGHPESGLACRLKAPAARSDRRRFTIPPAAVSAMSADDAVCLTARPVPADQWAAAISSALAIVSEIHIAMTSRDSES